METKVKIERDGKVFYTIRSRYVFNAVMIMNFAAVYTINSFEP